MSKANRFDDGMRLNRAITRPWFRALGAILLLALAGMASAETRNTLEGVSHTALPDDGVRLTLRFSEPPAEPLSFVTESPARIALDFADTRSGLAERTVRVGAGTVESLTAVEAKDRTRVVLNLSRHAGYETTVSGNDLIVTVRPDAPVAMVGIAPATEWKEPKAAHRRVVTDVDFRRGMAGEGRVLVGLSDPKTVVDIKERPGRVIVEFQRTHIPERLLRRLDVTDFATPIGQIDTLMDGDKARMVITVAGEYEIVSWQSDEAFVFEAKPKVVDEVAKAREKFPYVGERLSLNFQDIEVRSVLQLIADFTDLNMVVSDSVTGNITLRLKNVPWDQALDIILRTKGLGQRAEGNVIYVAPHTEIAQRFQEQQAAEQLAPLRSEIMQINYAKAKDIAALLLAKDGRLLSERGTVSVDERTNTLIVNDTADKLGEVEALLERLDQPVRQVLIESRIVVANDSFSRELGVRFGATGVRRRGDGIITSSGSAEGTSGVVDNALSNLNTTGQPFPVGVPALNDRFNVNLPVENPAGRLALAILGKNYLVDLELSAAQAEGKGEVISNPRVVTGNQGKAVIKQGFEIPYVEATSSGATSVDFKEAVLSLEVTPQITPDDRVIMDLKVNKDRPDWTRSVLGVPPIDTRSVETSVIVGNGETVVLGGIYEETSENQINKVPLLGDLPVMGHLFKNTSRAESRSELLIFITPRIFSDALDVR